jgi:hypothetical protein
MVETSTVVFVGGCTNSGTGLFRMIMTKQPSLSFLPQEGPKLTVALPDDVRCGLPRRLFALFPDVYRLTELDVPRVDFAQVWRDWSPHWDLAKPVLFEKCPANALRMRFLQAVVPLARFVGIVRHPYGVCEGIRRRRGHSIALCAQQWVTANRFMRADAGAVDHFLLIRYEDMAASPSATVAAACQLAGLTAVQSSLDGVFERHNITNCPQPIRKDFNDLSRSALSATEVDEINRLCWPFAAEFGYEPF